jgi:hypothetical protein
MHTRSRPYQCGVCLKSYGRSGILKNHMRTHLIKISGDSQISCSKFEQNSQSSLVLVGPIIPEPSEVTFEGNLTNNTLKTCDNFSSKKNLIRIAKAEIAPTSRIESNLNLTLKNLANISNFKEEDENITISSSINVNEDRTPVNLEQIRKAFSMVHHHQALQAQQLQHTHLFNSQMLDSNQNIKTEGLDLFNNKLLNNLHASNNSTKESYSTLAQGLENTNQNNNLSFGSSNKFNLSKIPRNVETNSVPDFNFMTPKNLNYGEDTPSNLTPTSRMQSRIKKLINSGQDTLNLEEATALYNFYFSNLSKFQFLNKNEEKDKNFTSLFEEYVHNSFKNGQNLSLQKILQLLENQGSPRTEINKNKGPQGSGGSQSSLNHQVSQLNQSNNINNLSSEPTSNMALMNNVAHINNLTNFSNLANMGSLNNTINNLTSLNTLASLNSLNNLNNFNQLNNLATLNTLNTLSTLNNLSNLNNLNNGITGFNPLLSQQVSSDLSNINSNYNIVENSPVFSFSANNLGGLSPLFAHNLLSNPNTTQNRSHKNSMSMDRSVTAQNLNQKMITFSDYFNSFNNN